MFIPTELGGLFTEPASTAEGRPEAIRLRLPIRLPEPVRILEALRIPLTTECERRRHSCLRALHLVRSIAVQQAHLLKNKKAHARGVKDRTRAEAALSRLSNKMSFARWTCSDC